jgi:hypothetical protein
VDALGGAGADDNVGQSGTGLEDEHGVFLAGLGLALADDSYLLRVSDLVLSVVGVSDNVRLRSKRFMPPS